MDCRTDGILNPWIATFHTKYEQIPNVIIYSNIEVLQKNRLQFTFNLPGHSY